MPPEEVWVVEMAKEVARALGTSLSALVRELCRALVEQARGRSSTIVINPPKRLEVRLNVNVNTGVPQGTVAREAVVFLLRQLYMKLRAALASREYPWLVERHVGDALRLLEDFVQSVFGESLRRILRSSRRP